jgi:hypothetical protein
MRATRKGGAGSDVKDATWPGLVPLVGGVVDDDVRLQLDQLMGLKSGGGDEIVEVAEPSAASLSYRNDVVCPGNIKAG